MAEIATQTPIAALAIDLALFSSGRVLEVIASVKNIGNGVCSYTQAFSEAAKREELAENPGGADTFQVLNILADFSLLSGDGKFPFQPRGWCGDKRTPIPDDLSDEQVELLYQAAEHLKEPELLARIYDVVWVRLKRHEAANLAIDKYLEAAKDDRIMEQVRFGRLERAFRLAKQINSAEKWKTCEKVFCSAI